MKKNDLLNIWDETKQFLQKTSANIDNPNFIRLKIYPIFDKKKLDKNLEEIIAVSERPTLEPIWNVSNNNLEKVIQGLQNVQPYMSLQHNAIELEIWYNFKFLDTLSLEELPNSECNSHVNFIFSKKHTCSPCLIFPFTDATSEFWKYLDTIKPMLPFELDEKLLRKVYVKNGSPSSLKKIVRRK